MIKRTRETVDEPFMRTGSFAPRHRARARPARPGVLVLVVLLLAAMHQLSAPQPQASAAPPGDWSSSYAHKRLINIDASTSAVPAGYQIDVTFDHGALVAAGQSLASGNDVRVVYWSGQTYTEVDRVLAVGSSWNSSATKIYFKSINGLAASSTNTDFYLFYGNPAAGSPPADPNNVYDLYEDWSSGSINGSKWGTLTMTGTTLSVNSGRLRLTGTPGSGVNCDGAGVYSLNDYLDDYAVETTFESTAMGANVQKNWSGTMGMDSNYLSITDNNGATTKRIGYWTGSSWSYVGTSVYANSAVIAPIRYTSTLSGGSAKMYENGTLVGTKTGITPIASSALMMFTPCASQAATVFWDDLVVRKFVANPPSASLTSDSTTTPEISAGDGHSCMIAVNKRAFCWGDNAYGQLGNGVTGGTSSEPVLVSGNITWRSIAAGYQFTCGVATDGTGYCWGRDQNGQLGNGASTTTMNTPTAMSGSQTWQSITASRNAHACGINTAGAAYCWGAGSEGRLGNNGTAMSDVPALVSGGFTWASLSLGTYHSCGVTTAQDAKCWGRNIENQLGDSSVTQRNIPTAVNGSKKWKMLGAGFYHSCGIDTDGNGWCWGFNGSGRLGDSSTTNRSVPRALTGTNQWLAISVGDEFTCAIKSNRDAYCWGINAYSQVGDNTTGARNAPTAVSGSLDYSNIAAGGTHACAVEMLTNLPKCWGRNTSGTVGDGTTTSPRAIPTNAFVSRGLLPTATSANEGNAGSTNFAMSVDTYQSKISNIPISATWATSDSTATTANSDYSATGGTAELAPGDTSAPINVSVTGDTTVEADETFNINISAPSTGASVQTASAAATILNDDVSPPDDPTSLNQTKTTSASISTGGFTDETSVRFTASAAHPTNPAQLQLCVEVKLVSVAFGVTENSCGSPVAYAGSPVTTVHTISGLSDAGQYHWRARIKDGNGQYSSWVAYGGNAESAADFVVDTTAPAFSYVRDGATQSVDVTLNDGALDSLGGNWNANDGGSGIAGYEYSIGTSPGATDVKGWTAHSGTTVTASGLDLQTGVAYYVNARATDNAGNVSGTSTSTGQSVAPTLDFGLSSPEIAFDTLSAMNSFASTPKTLTTTASTNARQGYTVRQYVSQPLSNGSATIPGYAGTYSSPTLWTGTGFGYTSDDTSIQSAGNIFGTGTRYAGLATSGPGDIVADDTGPVSGTPIVNQHHTFTYRVAASGTQQAGRYSTSLVIGAVAYY